MQEIFVLSGPSVRTLGLSAYKHTSWSKSGRSVTLTTNLYLVQRRAMPCLGQLLAGLSLQRAGFNSESFHLRFVMDPVALGLIFLKFVLPLSVIPPALDTPSFIYHPYYIMIINGSDVKVLLN